MEYTTRLGLQSQTTRLFKDASHVLRLVRTLTGFSPSVMLRSRRLIPGPRAKTPLQTTILRRDFKFELFPFHSPLLRESLLFSFPPLINMLKSSGYSCLSEIGTREACHSFSSVMFIEEIISGEHVLTVYRRIASALKRARRARHTMSCNTFKDTGVTPRSHVQVWWSRSAKNLRTCYTSPDVKSRCSNRHTTW